MDPLLTEMKTLSEKYEVPMSAIAINWVICKGAIPLGGARNAYQAEQVSRPKASRGKLIGRMPKL
jgi:aryl-alcohol dehydrogenase-like predicted oxidoreductase